ncbi:hypothetical protein [Caballeronia terrestris]|uniref:hypothetical protein n=1 Tax=Caballeronia terrestris TaxID=1226301 RepID=UPI000A904872|nr:hypothetical protein [Caballeronia terrestris]
MNAAEHIATTGEVMRAERHRFKAERLKLEAERQKRDREDRWMSMAAIIISIATTADIAMHIFHR